MTSEFRHVRSRDDLLVELHEQLAALRSSSAAYDSGTLWEAKRLATVAYVLLHDGGRNSCSLLGQLGLKGQFLSTVRRLDSPPLPLAIIKMEMGKGATFAPFLAEHSTEKNFLSFNKWYEEIVFENGHLKQKRKNLIFTLRSQAGGAHVDSEIKDEAFQFLSSKSQWVISSNGPGTAKDAAGNEVPCPPELEHVFDGLDGPVPNGNLATMRQIAWEIDQTLTLSGF